MAIQILLNQPKQLRPLVRETHQYYSSVPRRVSLNPGSDISGVPASDIKTTDLPDRNLFQNKG